MLVKLGSPIPSREDTMVSRDTGRQHMGHEGSIDFCSSGNKWRTGCVSLSSGQCCRRHKSRVNLRRVETSRGGAWLGLSRGDRAEEMQQTRVQAEYQPSREVSPALCAQGFDTTKPPSQLATIRHLPPNLAGNPSLRYQG